MNTKLIRTGTICAILAFVVTGCATESKNKPPPPVQPVAEAPKAVPAPAPAPKPEKIVLNGVNFDFDKSTLKPGARDILDHAVSVIQTNANFRFKLSGYTDSIGSDAYNQKLSERRVNAVHDYLVQHGVMPQRLDSVGYGESHPVATNATAEGRAQNRRVEIDPID